jgi:anti-sigma regulatory factor (Ser/Thr protein kinase)
MAVEHRLPATSGSPQSGFRHSALIVESDQSVRELLVPAVRQALAETGDVFVAVSADTASALRAELGPVAGTLEWGDTAGPRQRLGFAYEGFRRFLAAAHDAGRRIHVFAEPDLGPGTDTTAADGRVSAYLSYEAMGNETYAGYGCPVNCLWDARRYPAPVIEAVRAVHDHELRADGGQPSAGYVRPRDFLADRDCRPLTPPAAVDWELTLGTVDDLPALRAQLRGWARPRGFDPAATSDVILGVNEIVTNGLIHGAPPVAVRAWSHRDTHHHDTLIVQVNDRGGKPLPSLGGYQPPDEKQDRTRGLWLARQLADVVQTNTADGTTAVRLRFPYQLTHQRPPYLGGETG